MKWSLTKTQTWEIEVEAETEAEAVAEGRRRADWELVDQEIEAVPEDSEEAP